MLDKKQSFPNDLLSGYKEFKEDHLPEARARYEILAELGQKPKTMIVSCCDSRAAPETIFNSAPGELFVVRNVANLVPPYEADDGFHGTSAALEFAVQALKVENIVIMGHGRCGGVQAFLLQDEGVVETKPLSPGDFIGKWITLLEPAKDKMICEDGADFASRKRAMEEAGIRNSIDNLMTFPCVKTQVERGKITLHGAWFDISTGELYTMDHETGEFSTA
ncbi:MAG: carbonic anhydrase [Hyphomicrobiales bacterium]